MTTEQLYDSGEETWERKIHVGCGGIFLESYENIDIQGVLASEHPELVEQNKTTVQDYYARLDGNLNNLPQPRETVVNRIADARGLPHRPNSVDKILALQVLEHLTHQGVLEALLRWWNILKPNAPLVLSVPDVPATIKLAKAWETIQFAIRHLEGAQKDAYSPHVSWFSEQNLIELLTQMGFKQIQILPNVHFYPAICIRCFKDDAYVSDRSYQYPLPGLDSTCETVLDVGPGNFPLPSATHCLDIDNTYSASRQVPADIGSIERTNYADGQWDYVYISHALEHCASPARGLAEAQRVGKRGYAECPVVMTDYMFAFGETHPRWMCLPIPNGIAFIEKSPEYNQAFLDKEVGAFFYRVTQYPIMLSRAEQAIRIQFWRNQRIVNAFCSWDEHRTARALEIRLDGSVVECVGKELRQR